MPLVTLTVHKPKSTAFKAGVLDAVHADQLRPDPSLIFDNRALASTVVAR